MVDKIYEQPSKKAGASGQVTLNTNKMNTLTYFSTNYPEKVARVAAYFHYKIMKQIKKKKIEHIDVSLQALDILLASSQGHSYNLYAEHFLVVASKLLETNDPQLQQLATRSMEKFALIREETPMYHGCYDLLIEKYSAMCKDSEARTRITGAKGLHAIVDKTALDKLAENIWRPDYLNKMVSGLLFCMSQFRLSPGGDEIDPDVAGKEAEKCMAALMSTASFGQVTSVMNSVYSYLDTKNLWDKRLFTNYVYRIIMNSIQSRYWHAIIINGIAHLEQNSNAPVGSRRNELTVLCTLLELMKHQALGTLMFDYLNFLFGESCRIARNKSDDPQEQMYCQDLMDCLEGIANELAEFESLEVMVFIADKILESYEDPIMKDVLFRCLYTVAAGYKNRFPVQLIKPLLYLMQEQTTMIMGHVIFHTLLDMHGNLASVNEPSYNMNLKNKPYCSANVHFVRDYGMGVYLTLLRNISLENLEPDHLNAVYKTMTTMAVYQDPSIFPEFLACLLLMQEMAVPEKLSVEIRLYILTFTLGLALSSARICGLYKLVDYTGKTVLHRENTMRLVKNADLNSHFAECCLLDEHKLNCCMEISQTKVGTFDLSRAVATMRANLDVNLHIKGEASKLIDSPMGQTEDSAFPALGSVPEDLTVEAMKNILAIPFENIQKKKAEELRELKKKYETCTLADIIQDLGDEEDDKLQEIKMQIINSPTYSEGSIDSKPVSQILEERFPDVFR